MKGTCPNCEREADIQVIESTENLEIRGESVETKVKYYKCTVCEQLFEDPRIEDDPLERAYREYRRRHGMTQPEAIRAIRKKYGLTQGELARLLGWGIATLSRYENGALQSSAHDRILALAMEPRNLLKLVDDIPDAHAARQ